MYKETNKLFKMTKKNLHPTDSELEILQLLWQEGASSVRNINDILNQKREVGYTTTLKLMQIMLEKGLVNRNEDQRTHIYCAAVREQDTQKKLLDNFVASAFRGASMKMVIQALGNHNASKEELNEIKALIKEIEKKNKI